jgi:hypothetical protein
VTLADGQAEGSCSTAALGGRRGFNAKTRRVQRRKG